MTGLLGEGYIGRICEWCFEDTGHGYARMCSEACVIRWSVLMRWTLKHDEGPAPYHDSLIGRWISVE